MSQLRLFLLAAVLVVGGCSLAPTYTRPESPTPAAWPAGAAYPAAPAAAGALPAEIPWQTFFTDARLKRIIASAIENNRDLRIAALNVERARAIYGIRRSELFPAVTAAAGANIQRVPADLSTSGQARTSERYDVNLGIVSWEIDFFGRIRSLEDSARQAFLATAQARRGTRNLLVSAVAGAYLALAADRENLALAETTLTAQQAAFDLVGRRHEAGLASALDINRARTQLEAARRDIARYTQQAAKDVNALNFLAGAAVPMREDLLPKNLADVTPVNTAFMGLPSEVLLNRPDILAAEHVLKGLNANIGAARAALFPRISLTTTAGTASAALSGLFGAGSQAWTFVPQATLPIFDARLWSALDATAADKEIAVAQYERAVQTAFREVADALAGRGTLGREVAAQQALVDAAAESLRLSMLRYTQGVDSYLGVLDAQRTLFAAQQVLVFLRLAERGNQVQLYAVLGGGGGGADGVDTGPQ